MVFKKILLKQYVTLFSRVLQKTFAN